MNTPSFTPDANDPQLAEALLGVIKVATAALWTSGRALNVELLAQVLNVRNKHVRTALHILTEAGWCVYDKPNDRFFPKSNLRVLSHRMQQHFIKALDMLNADLLERTGMIAVEVP